MQIILEGPDAVGKSTMAQKLAQALELEIIHLTSKDINTFAYHRWLLDHHDDCVFDRFCLGESVYPLIYGREEKMNDNEVLNCFEYMMKKDAILAIMYSSKVSILEDRLLSRGEVKDMKDISKQNYLYAGLAYILRTYEYPGLLTWDIATRSYDDLLATITTLYHIRRVRKKEGNPWATIKRS